MKVKTIFLRENRQEQFLEDYTEKHHLCCNTTTKTNFHLNTK